MISITYGHNRSIANSTPLTINLINSFYNHSPDYISLVLLFKQKTNLGSSETTRKAFCMNFFEQIQNFSNKQSYFNFSSYLDLKPSHKNVMSNQFLEWFIGFSEGDGCFGLKKGRPFFMINQADLGLMYTIRTQLGFGKVLTFQQDNKIYARYSVSNKEGIKRLISLFNGNIHLHKTHRRFDHWTNAYNVVYNENICIKPRLVPNLISLKTSWLAGFFDAEGCCYAGFSLDNRMKTGFRLRLKASIDQKCELDILKQISDLFELQRVTIRDNKKEYYRVEMVSKKSLSLITHYLDKHKLQGRKAEVYAVWKRLVNRYISNQHLIMDPTLLKKRVEKVQQLNQAFKNEKNVYNLLKEQNEPYKFNSD